MAELENIRQNISKDLGKLTTSSINSRIHILLNLTYSTDRTDQIMSH